MKTKYPMSQEMKHNAEVLADGDVKVISSREVEKNGKKGGQYVFLGSRGELLLPERNLLTPSTSLKQFKERHC